MTKKPSTAAVLSDKATLIDGLNVTPYAKTLAEIIADTNTDTPLTIGVFGSWGQGKTSLMQMVREKLKDSAPADFAIHTVWFNAWLYSQQPTLWRALISKVLTAARNFNFNPESQRALDAIEKRLYGVTQSESGYFTLPTADFPMDQVSLPPLMGLDLLRRQLKRKDADDERLKELDDLLADVSESETQNRRETLNALDDFRREFENISQAHIVNNGRVVIFVDDLDRCLPDKAVEVLEAIKLFLDVSGCIFVLGVDREVIEEGIKVRYADYEATLNGAQYLEKIIQIPFALPPIDTDAINAFIHQITNANLPTPLCETVFSAGLEANPRRIKRTLNIFLLLWRLSQNREDLNGRIKPVRLAKIVVIQQYHPRLFKLLTEGAHYLLDLEKRFMGQTATKDDMRQLPVEGEPEAVETASAGPLEPFLHRTLLRDLLTCTPSAPDANFADLPPAKVREYIYLTRSSVEETAADTTDTALLFEPQMLTIPAGVFLMGTTDDEARAIEKMGLERDMIEQELPQHEVNLDAYAISRYPITNAEFARFIEDGGYGDKDYWSDAGWQSKENETWTQPRYWDDKKWNDPAQPVVGVSWYEAYAYCRWLSAKSGKDYRLPTEAEWEKAARGTDGRRYPWGNQWDAALCNNKESGPGKTTPVGDYPEGKSPYGVEEMAGQVWEWCNSKFKAYPYKPDDRENVESDDRRVLRGGSWYDDDPATVCRVGYRDRDDPDFSWDDVRGFRCARSLSGGS